MGQESGVRRSRVGGQKSEVRGIGRRGSRPRNQESRARNRTSRGIGKEERVSSYLVTDPPYCRSFCSCSLFESHFFCRSLSFVSGSRR